MATYRRIHQAEKLQKAFRHYGLGLNRPLKLPSSGRVCWPPVSGSARSCPGRYVRAVRWSRRRTGACSRSGTARCPTRSCWTAIRFARQRRCNVTIRDLVRQVLRHRPEHVVVGEVGGAVARRPCAGVQQPGTRLPRHRAREPRRSGALAPGDLRDAGDDALTLAVVCRGVVDRIEAAIHQAGRRSVIERESGIGRECTDRAGDPRGGGPRGRGAHSSRSTAPCSAPSCSTGSCSATAGARSRASGEREGLLAPSSGGTVFLGEVAELTPGGEDCTERLDRACRRGRVRPARQHGLGRRRTGHHPPGTVEADGAAQDRPHRSEPRTLRSRPCPARRAARCTGVDRLRPGAATRFPEQDSDTEN